MTEFPFKTLIP